MSKVGSIASLLVTLVALSGCDKPKATAAPAPVAPALPVVPAREPAPTLPALPSAQPARIPLGERLAREAEARPEGALRAQSLIEALSARGVTVAESRQVLASPIGALYCEAAVSERGLALSLCAFSDAAAVTAGRDRSRTLFDRIVPGRSLVARGNTLLTLAPADGAANEAEVAQEVFAALVP